MTSRGPRGYAALVACLAAAALVAGCGGGSSAEAKRHVRAVAERARADLLAGRSKDFCGLLTAHGRRRALGFKVDFDDEGSIPPDSPRLPQTCEQIVNRELAMYSNPDIHQLTPLDDLKRVRIRIVDVNDSSARVELVPPGSGSPSATAQVVKTDSGWRIDDSNVVPNGH
jgi:hypothetical protein